MFGLNLLRKANPFVKHIHDTIENMGRVETKKLRLSRDLMSAMDLSEQDLKLAHQWRTSWKVGEFTIKPDSSHFSSKGGWRDHLSLEKEGEGFNWLPNEDDETRVLELIREEFKKVNV